MKRITVHRKTKSVVYEWKGVAAGTGVSPSSARPPADDPIDVRDAESIAIQASTKDSNNTSTDVDINVLATVRGEDVQLQDSVPYAERNLGDDQVKTFLVAPGPDFITLQLDNNAAATSAYVTARVYVRYRVHELEEEE